MVNEEDIKVFPLIIDVFPLNLTCGNFALSQNSVAKVAYYLLAMVEVLVDP